MAVSSSGPMKGKSCLFVDKRLPTKWETNKKLTEAARRPRRILDYYRIGLVNRDLCKVSAMAY